MFRKFIVCVAVIISFCLFNNVSAQQFGPPIPLFLNFQGKLEFQGIPTSDTQYITFRIYDVPEGLPEGGVPLWDETQLVETRVGIFNVILGEEEGPIPLIFDQDYWLGVQVEGEDEMSPRQRISSSGYSFMAQDSYLLNGNPSGKDNDLVADMVDDIHATDTPVKDTLLALDDQSKFPNSVLYMGHEKGINADMLDDYHYEDISKEIDNKIAAHEVRHLSKDEMDDLSDSGETSLHYHASDRNLANATGILDKSHLDSDQVQMRVTGTCGPGSSIRTINSDGSVVCEPDTDTQLSKSTIQQWANEVDDVNDAVSNPSGSYPSMSVGYANRAGNVPKIQVGTIPTRYFSSDCQLGDGQVIGINFSKPFSSIPTIVISGKQGRFVVWEAYNITTTGFTAHGRNSDCAAGNASAQWIAVAL